MGSALEIESSGDAKCAAARLRTSQKSKGKSDAFAIRAVP